MLPALVEARIDEGSAKAATAGILPHEEVVHDADALGNERVPAPVHGREPDRGVRFVACEQLHALMVRVGDQGSRDGEQCLVRRTDFVEIAIVTHERKQVRELVFGDAGNSNRSTRASARGRRSGPVAETGAARVQ